MDELKAQAESLGIEVDGRWSEKRIQAEIDKALAADPVSDSNGQSIEITVTPAPITSAAAMADKVSEILAKSTAQPGAQKSVTVTNLRDNPNKRLGLKARGQIVLTADQLGNKHLMARIMHGVETGVLDLS